MAYAELARLDPVFARLVRRHGEPDPFRWEDGGRTGDSNFAAMLLHITSQQISTVVALAIYDRLRAALGGVPDPAGILRLGRERLRGVGLSGAKADYMLGLAELEHTGALDLDRLDEHDDEQTLAALMSIRGVGLWSAEMFLLYQLRRPDVFPAADVELRHAIARAWKLAAVPATQEARDRALLWSPYRSYAAALLWASVQE